MSHIEVHFVGDARYTSYGWVRDQQTTNTESLLSIIVHLIIFFFFSINIVSNKLEDITKTQYIECYLFDGLYNSDCLSRARRPEHQVGGGPRRASYNMLHR